VISKDISSRKALFALLLITLLAFSLRTYSLDTESIWVDEAYSLRYAFQENSGVVMSEIAQTEAAPFGYYLLLHKWIKWFGTSVFAARFLSVIFGVLAVLLLYFMIVPYFGRKTALLSSLFMAVSMTQVLYSQEIRLYSLFTFLSLFSTYSFLRLFRAETTSSRSTKSLYLSYGLYILAMLLCLYVNYISVFLVFLFTLYILWNWKRSRHFFFNWILIHTLMGLFLIPLFPLLLKQYQILNAGAAATYLKLGVPAALAKLGIWMFTLPLVLVGGLLALTLVFRKKVESSIRRIKMPSWLFFVAILVFSASYVYLTLSPLTIFGIPLFRVPITNSYFLVRHSLFLAPVIYVLFSYLSLKMFSKKLAVISILLILLTSLFSLGVYYVTPTKMEWEEAVSYIHEQSEGTPSIFLDSGGIANSFSINYYDQGFSGIHNLTWTTGWRQAAELSPQEVAAAFSSEEKFWLLLSKNSRPYDYYQEKVPLNYRLEDSEEFYGLSLYKYSVD